MKKLGLIGRPLQHSFSKKYFAEKFQVAGISDWKYDLYPLPNIDALPKLLKEHPNLVGLNITIPYKKEALKYVQDLDEEALKIGAINTLKISPSGKLKGYNTDVIGFQNSLIPFLGKSIEHVNALVLGTGGAAQAVHFVLKKLNISATQISRNPAKGTTYGELNEESMMNNHLIINCTPLGTFPNIDESPDIPYERLTEKHFLFDLVYNPQKTLFLSQGIQKGAQTMNGYSMLEMQAEASWKIWNEA